MLDPRVGTTVYGRYLLKRELARGAMGSVWVAQDKRLERPVAVKTLKATWAGSVDARTRFEREAMAVAKLHSPYIVQIYDYGIDNGCPFIVMELLKGEDLEARLKKRKRIGVWDLVPIVVQSAKALTVAHSAGIVHRDLKPGNLFLVRSEEEELVKILDFGVAKADQPTDGGSEEQTAEAAKQLEDQSSTKAGTLLGTPLFMSPEQARGIQGIDLRADIWSLGVIVFKALTGKLPFLGGNVTDTIVRICTAPVPIATDIAPDLPVAVNAFFARCLARNPAERFNSARELAAAFLRIAPPQSHPSITLPGLPSDVRQDIIEATVPHPIPEPAAAVAERAAGALSQPAVQRGGAQAARGVLADVGAGRPLGGAEGSGSSPSAPAADGPFKPAPSARTPKIGPTARSEAVALKPPGQPDFHRDRDDDEDDDEVTRIHRSAPMPGAAPAMFPLASDEQDEPASDRAAEPPPRSDPRDSLNQRDITPPPLPGAAPDINDETTTDRAIRAADASASPSSSDPGVLPVALRESHGTLGSQAIDAATVDEVPRRGTRRSLMLSLGGAIAAIVTGAVLGLATSDDSASSDSALGADATSSPAVDDTSPATGTDSPEATGDGATTDETPDDATEPETSGDADAGADAEPAASDEPSAEPPPPVTVASPPPRPWRPPTKPKPKPPPPPEPKPPPDDDAFGSRY